MPELPPAAASLAAQAEQQRERGDYVTAAATLERALRIQPQEPYLWNRLARVRLDQQNYAQAGSLAQKSNALSKDQGQIKQDNWGMIAATRRAAGDLSGAEEAEAKAGGD
jgi:tetratricopeptide (TPR) repeat protein